MGGVNRRDLFRAAGSLFAALLARRAARAAAASIPPAPVARVEVVKDSYFGDRMRTRAPCSTPSRIATGC
jgi:hypothetical protein